MTEFPSLPPPCTTVNRTASHRSTEKYAYNESFFCFRVLVSCLLCTRGEVTVFPLLPFHMTAAVFIMASSTLAAKLCRKMCLELVGAASHVAATMGMFPEAGHANCDPHRKKSRTGVGNLGVPLHDVHWVCPTTGLEWSKRTFTCTSLYKPRTASLAAAWLTLATLP